MDLGELAVLLGTDEVTVANEISAMERAKIICGYHTLIDWDKTGTEYVNADRSKSNNHSVTRDLIRQQNGSVIIRKYQPYI